MLMSNLDQLTCTQSSSSLPLQLKGNFCLTFWWPGFEANRVQYTQMLYRT